ncbi:MAG: hypothetical protein CFE45_12110 [Burkholderiales bacterium PBB5]|nr:MAG: hypothetical protein CFE45_12110 [Burkholderiales bacterium PBB5]
MHRLVSHLQAHVRLAGAMALGGMTALALPAQAFSPVSRGLLGWNVAVWLYLGLLAAMMARADHRRLRQVADRQAESAGTVLALVSVAAIVSLLGTVLELGAAKQLPGAVALPHVALALATVAGSWLLVPTVFALTYASRYYRGRAPGGLQFPGADATFTPGYGDFLYFSITIAVACQTADVSVSHPAMRRLVLLQSMLAFAVNTAILALTINIAASLF